MIHLILSVKMYQHNAALKIKKGIVVIKQERLLIFHTAAPEPLASIPMTTATTKHDLLASTIILTSKNLSLHPHVSTNIFCF